MTATTLTITDLTRMSGNRVCVAGIADDRNTIRPELEDTPITEDWLFSEGNLIIRPFARVKFDLIENRPDAPHTEDWIIRANFKEFERNITLDERLKLLKSISNVSVTGIFETEIGHEYGHGYFIQHGQGSRSLGTLRPRIISDFVHTIYPGPKLDYRIGFEDWDRQSYRLGITDLNLRSYVDKMRMQDGLSYEEISSRISHILQNSQVFLRIGLARATDPRHPGFCHLQINGVYTFPDYLEGLSFADFKT